VDNINATDQLAFCDGVEIAEQIAAGHLTALATTQYFLERIERLNGRLNAFTVVMADKALRRAAELDALQAKGEPLGKLHGVPIVVKDDQNVAGTITTHGGAAFSRVQTQHSVLVQRLVDAGAVILGKTRMPEFGSWALTESEHYGHTHNPWNLQHSPAGLAPFGVGGDGGGSIRLPASWCGLFGMKPQLGRVSTAPNTNVWRNLGALGCLSRSVRDSALFYDVTQGTTEGVDQYAAVAWESTLSEVLQTDPKPLKIAYSLKSPTPWGRVEEATAAGIRQLAQTLSALGHEVVERDPKYPDQTLAFVPQWFGAVYENAKTADSPKMLESKTRQMVFLSHLFRSAWLGRQAAAAAKRYEVKLNAIFDHVDVLITPSTPTPAKPVGQLGKNFFVAAFRSLSVNGFASPWNIATNPAAAIPNGFAANGLPLSAQVIVPPHQEPLLMALAAQIERAAPWSNTKPNLD